MMNEFEVGTLVLIFKKYYVFDQPNDFDYIKATINGSILFEELNYYGENQYQRVYALTDEKGNVYYADYGRLSQGTYYFKTIDDHIRRIKFLINKYGETNELITTLNELIELKGKQMKLKNDL